jgi:hypothetical protein
VRFAVSYRTASLGVDFGHLVAYARHAQACGFEALFMPEHVVLYHGAMLGSMELPPDLPLVDTLDALSFVAAATSRPQERAAQAEGVTPGGGQRDVRAPGRTGESRSPPVAARL